MRIAPWTVAGSLAMGCAFAAGQDRYRTENVVIAVMYGTAWRATFGDPEHRYIPRLWNELRPQGTLYTRFYNDDVTINHQGRPLDHRHRHLAEDEEPPRHPWRA